MNNNYLITGLLVILSLGIGYTLGNNQETATEPAISITTSASENTSSMTMEEMMNGMMAGLEGKKGDDFDKAFLEEMIMHHEGAVLMAEAALDDAKHKEIITLAEVIISAQTTEIDMMKEWYTTWYGNEMSDNMMHMMH